MPSWRTLAVLKSVTGTRTLHSYGIRYDNHEYWGSALATLTDNSKLRFFAFDTPFNRSISIVQGHQYIGEAHMVEKLNIVEAQRYKVVLHLMEQKRQRRFFSQRLAELHNIILQTDILQHIDLACTNTRQIDVLRQSYDDTGAPMIICGTYELYDLLTGEDSRHRKYSHNKPQISRRLRKEEFEKIQEQEIDCYLTELEQYYAVRFEPPVRAKLISICSDRMNGGLGNFIEVLELLFSTERPEWEEISYQIIRDTNRVLHTHSDPIQIPSYVVCEDQPSEKSMDVFAEECDPPAEDPHPRIDVSKLPVVTITRSSINDALRHKMGR